MVKSLSGGSSSGSAPAPPRLDTGTLSSEIPVSVARHDDDIFPAAINGDAKRVRELVNAGVSPNYASLLFQLKTPLHLASEKGHIDVVRFLLEKGAELDRRDMQGVTPSCSPRCKGTRK